MITIQVYYKMHTYSTGKTKTKLFDRGITWSRYFSSYADTEI